MKPEAVLAAIAVSLSFLSGYLALNVSRNPRASPSAPVLELELRKFEREFPSQENLRMSALNEFVDPRNLLPSEHRYSYKDVRLLEAARTDCGILKKHSPPGHPDLKKAWKWQEFLCSGQKAPDDFFTKAPYFHPSGHTYAFLAKQELAWQQKNQDLFHVLELKELGFAGLNPSLLLLSQLDWRDLASLSEGTEVVLGQNVVFLKSREEKPLYRVYPLELWDKYWSQTPFHLRTNTSGAPCFSRQGSACWDYEFRLAYFHGWSPLVLLLVLSVVLTLFSFALVATRIHRRQKGEERLKFALEMLTHELRTPLTVLHLAVDQFRGDFNELPARSQSLVLRVFDQVERLKRVAEASRQYLAKDLGTSMLSVQATELPALREFVEHALEPYREQVELSFEGVAAAVRTDPFWASVCLKNLVENALKHGSPPVRVRVRQGLGEWSVEVEDGGQTTFDPIKRGPASSGLGLGLALVRKILPHLHGELIFSFQPTIARLRFRELP